MLKYVTIHHSCQFLVVFILCGGYKHGSVAIPHDLKNLIQMCRAKCATPGGVA